jgi:hypothetical protein
LENNSVIFRYNFYEYNWNAFISTSSLFKHKRHTDTRFFDNCK